MKKKQKAKYSNSSPCNNNSYRRRTNLTFNWLLGVLIILKLWILIMLTIGFLFNSCKQATKVKTSIEEASVSGEEIQSQLPEPENTFLCRAPIYKPSGFFGKFWDGFKAGLPGEHHYAIDFQASPDAEHLAYLAIQVNRDIFQNATAQNFIVLDGEEKRRFDYITLEDHSIWSPDSKHIAFRALSNSNNKWFVVLDGNEERDYKEILPPIFSPDSKRLAYVAKDNKQWRVVVDGNEDKEYKEVISVVFSQDSKQLAYAAKCDKNWCVVVDNKERKDGYKEITSVTFSPDAKYLAFTAKCSKNWCVIVDNEEMATNYKRITSLIFSPDSKHFAYTARVGSNEWCVIVDGVESKKYKQVNSLIFSPNSKRFAYTARCGKLWCVVVDGEENKGYEEIKSLAFSPDSKRVVYAGKKEKNWAIIMDEKEGITYDEIFGRIVFQSNDTVRFIAIRGEEAYKVCQSIDNQ